MGFVIYDLETTGLKKRFDQILQFAAVRTDENLEVLEQVQFEGRLRPHILPSPGALHVTGADLTALASKSRSASLRARSLSAMISASQRFGRIGRPERVAVRSAGSRER